MEILTLLDQVYINILTFTLISVRIFTFFTLFILFRRDLVSPRITIALTAILSFYVLAMTPALEKSDIFSVKFLVMGFYQSLIGLITAMAVNIIFEVFSALGQLISSQIGLNLASLFDPKFGVITSLTHFYIILAMVIFFLLNGHLVIIQTLVQSFSVIPLNFLIFKFPVMVLLRYANVIFTGAVTLSLTVFIVILLTNICLAVMTKFAPQINLFSVGLNLTLLIGLITVFITFGLIVEQGQDFIRAALDFFNQYPKEWLAYGR